MLLSIIVPLFNTERFINQCLASMIEDSLINEYEVIVIDDGSTDNSANLVKDFCSKYHNIFLYQQNNCGVSIARMNGVSKAKGDYIWFVDSDDWVEPGSLQVILERIEENPETDVLVFPFYLRFPDSQKDSISPSIKESRSVTGKKLLRSRQYNFVGPPHFIIKRPLFQDKWLHFPEQTRFEDEYFSRVLLYKTETVSLFTKPLYNYRQNPDSFMHSSSIATAPFIFKVYKHLKCFAESEVKESDQKWFCHNITSFLLESITRYLDQVHSTDFNLFCKEHLPYLRKEFLMNLRCFPFKERVLGWFLLLLPKQYSEVLNWHNSQKRRKQQANP